MLPRPLWLPLGALALTVACDAQPTASQTVPQSARSMGVQPAEAPAVADGEGEAATCVSGVGVPAPCRIQFEGGADDMTMSATSRDGGEHVFAGRRQDGWWSGTLNGAPAMAHELNRGHVVFASTDLGARFEYWTAGNEHGRY